MVARRPIETMTGLRQFCSRPAARFWRRIASRVANEQVPGRTRRGVMGCVACGQRPLPMDAQGSRDRWRAGLRSTGSQQCSPAIASSVFPMLPRSRNKCTSITRWQPLSRRADCLSTIRVLTHSWAARPRSRSLVRAIYRRRMLNPAPLPVRVLAFRSAYRAAASVCEGNSPKVAR